MEGMCVVRQAHHSCICDIRTNLITHKSDWKGLVDYVRIYFFFFSRLKKTTELTAITIGRSI